MVVPLPKFTNNSPALVELYRGMILTRTFDAKAIALQRTGRLGTFASSLGQEAVAVGVAAAMRVGDVLLPSFREQGAQLWRGVTLKELFLYWGGDERGNDFAGPRADFPNCVPVGSHAPHAVGVALAFRLRKRAARRRLRLWRRRHLKRRRCRSPEYGRRLAGSRRFRREQQRLGDFGAAGKADRGANACAEGDRRRHPGRAGGRQRCRRGSFRSGACARARACRGGPVADRSRDLSSLRSHDG